MLREVIDFITEKVGIKNWEDLLMAIGAISSFFALIAEIEPKLAIIPIILSALMKSLKDWVDYQKKKRGE